MGWINLNKLFVCSPIHLRVVLSCMRKVRKEEHFPGPCWMLQGRNLGLEALWAAGCVFDLGDLSDGVYQLTLSNSDRTETHRLVKASD